MCIDEWWVVVLWCLVAFPGVTVPGLWIAVPGFVIALYVLSAWQILPTVRENLRVLALD